jgi:hypothetical protein
MIPPCFEGNSLHNIRLLQKRCAKYAGNSQNCLIITKNCGISPCLTLTGARAGGGGLGSSSRNGYLPPPRLGVLILGWKSVRRLFYFKFEGLLGVFGGYGGGRRSFWKSYIKSQLTTVRLRLRSANLQVTVRRSHVSWRHCGQHSWPRTRCPMQTSYFFPSLFILS